MPVSEQTPVNSYTGNGVTTVFPYTFKLLAQADIEVTVDGVVKTLTTDYSVSGVGVDGGGNVTFVTAPANGTTVVLHRAMAYKREIDYQENGDLPAATLDEDVDRVVMMAQQLDEENDRAIHMAVGTTGVDTELPAPEAGKFIGWNSTEDGLQNYTAADMGAVSVTAFAETLLDDASAVVARDTLGLGTSVLQVVEGTASSTNYSISDAQLIPFDGTIPQSSEGVQAVTATITPKNSANRLRITCTFPAVLVNSSGSSGNWSGAVAALFKDSDVSAIAATLIAYVFDITLGSSGVLIHEMPAGGTSAITFKVRIGKTTAGTPVRFMGDGAFGTGISPIRIRVEEIET